MNVGKRTEPMTHEQIAQVFGVSRSKIQHIERTAMQKIRELLKERGLKPQDLLDIK